MIPMRTEQWKAVERAVAPLLAGDRVPVTGRARGLHPMLRMRILSLEVKHKAALPNWLHDAMAQARAANDGTKANVVILHEAGQRYDRSYAVLPLADLRELIDLIGASRS
jgi:hypothetical protein